MLAVKTNAVPTLEMWPGRRSGCLATSSRRSCCVRSPPCSLSATRPPAPLRESASLRNGRETVRRLSPTNCETSHSGRSPRQCDLPNEGRCRGINVNDARRSHLSAFSTKARPLLFVGISTVLRDDPAEESYAASQTHCQSSSNRTDRHARSALGRWRMQ